MKADKGRKFGSGGSMKESKAMMKKEVSFMKKKGAPASMIKHEEAEYGMRHGGKVKKMADGGYAGSAPKLPPQTPPIEPEEYERRVRGTREGMMGGRRMAKGGVAGSYRRAADGIANKGKTKGHTVKMREGGSVGGSFRRVADGIASKGKTKGKIVRMNYGGKC